MRRIRTASALVAVASMAALGLTTSATAASRPSAPSSLQVVTKGSGSYLAWTSTAKRFVVEQATDSTFTTGLHSYKVRQPEKDFTPYLTTPGATYYYRVRA